MSIPRGGSHGLEEPSADLASAEEALEPSHGAVTVDGLATDDGVLDPNVQADLKNGFATPCVPGRISPSNLLSSLAVA